MERVEEGGKDMDAEMGICPEDGYRLHAPGAAPAWYEGGAEGESWFSAGSLWRKHLLVHLFVGGLLLPSC